jgi:hypothetical protein
VLANCSLLTETKAVVNANTNSSAYRQPNWAKEIKILEVDSHETQTAKIKILSNNKIGIPSNVSFVPINFETESLSDVLSKTKIDFNIPTFVSWLGVTMYLLFNFSDTYFFTPDDIEKRYFIGRADKLPIPKVNSIISTRV